MKTYFEIDVFQFNEKVFTQSRLKSFILNKFLKQQTSAQNNLSCENFKYPFNATKIKLSANLLRFHPTNERYDDVKNDHYLVFHDRFQRSERFFQSNVQNRLIQSEGVLIIDSHGKVSFKPDRSFLIQRGETRLDYSLTERKPENSPTP